jgi:hypothetical protein
VLKCCAPDGVQHFDTAIGLTKKRRAPRRLGSGANLGIVVSRHIDERWRATLGHEPATQFEPRHAAEMDVEHQAIESGTRRVSEELLS